MSTIKVTTEPLREPLELETVQRHIAYADADVSTLLEGLISAARQWCESYCRRRFIDTVLRETFDCFPRGDRLCLSGSPFSAMATSDAVQYTATDGTVTTMSTSDYAVSSDVEPAAIVRGYGTTWPTLRYDGVAHPVQVNYTAGYGTEPESVPQCARQAMLLLCGAWFDNREAESYGGVSNKLKLGVESLLGPIVLGTYP